MTALTLFAEDLARKNSEALSYIPRGRLEQYEEAGQIMAAYENGELCGFLVHGCGWPVMRIFQACVHYDVRRRAHAAGLVAALAAKSQRAGCEEITLWCADDLEANEFWQASGFWLVRRRPGGLRRGRVLNLWALQLASPQQLLAL